MLKIAIREHRNLKVITIRKDKWDCVRVNGLLYEL